MNVRLYANTSSLALTERLDGGSFQPPVLAAYSDLHIRFRLAETLDGTPVLDGRELVSILANIGWPDTAPTSGTYQLRITLGADSVVTTDIAFDATAAQRKTAIDTALLPGTIAALSSCSVTEYEGVYRIAFNDKSQMPTITCEENSLWPASFVDIDEIEFNEGWAYMLQERQTPVATVPDFSQEVPTAPSISRLQAGSETDGVSINEIQKLTIPPAFSGGSFRIDRDGVKTVPITVPTDIATLRTAVAELADDGGTFVLTELDDGVYLEFTGTMAGTAQDLMTVVVFESPGTDYFFRLSTRTDPMRTLMRGADETGQVEVPLNITLEIADPAGDADNQEITIVQALRFTRPNSTGANNVAAALVWDQPLSRRDYLRHSTDSLLVGNRGMEKTIGDGVATSFTIPHNLLENSQVFTASSTTDIFTAVEHGFANGDPVNFANTGGALPTGVVEGTTYYVKSATADTFQVAVTPAGTAIDLTSNGTGTNTVVLADGTAADAVFVQVWKTAGDKDLVSPENYTVTRPSNNSVTVSGFAVTPTAGQYQVLVMTLGRPATYQGHRHPIDEIDGLTAALETINSRLAALEALSPSTVSTRTTLIGGTATRSLGSIWTVPRTRRNPAKPAALLDWRISAKELDEKPRNVLRLLPAVHDTSVETIPAAPLPVPSSAYAGRVFTTAAARTDFPGGGLEAGDFAACDGREWYRVAQIGSDSSYYPVAFETLLFETTVNSSEFPLGSRVDLDFGIEAMVLMLEDKARTRRSSCSWSLILEAGSHTADSTPGTPGSNLAVGFSSPITLLEQRIVLTEIPGSHTFGVSIARSTAGVLSADARKYGDEVATTAPASANFAIRARMIRFDTENAPTDARGIVALRGLSVGLDGQEDNSLGRLVITK